MVSPSTTSNAEKQSQNPDNQRYLKILDCPLPPDIKQIFERDEERNASALGYLALALQHVYSYYDLPMRFPVTYVGSRSTVEDRISHENGGPPRGSCTLSMSKGDSGKAKFAIAMLRGDIKVHRLP